MQEFKFGVVGKNINYSQSPFIHSTFGKNSNLTVRYTIEDVGDLSFEEKIARLREQGFAGCNITVPYKENAFKLADMTSERAKQAGAANTFIFKDTLIYADNTDGIGFIKDVTQNLKISLKDKKILICGAGGAVRGILGPILNCLPASITISNRTYMKAKELAEEFSNDTLKIIPENYANLAGLQFNIIIDGTSLKSELVPIPQDISLNEDSLIYDLKYSPDMKTSIMVWGEKKGAQAVDGMGMLVEQAAEAFRIWTGVLPETKPVMTLMKEIFYASAPSPK